MEEPTSTGPTPSQQWQRLKDIFQLLLECDPSERPERLDEACAGDIGLRREIELLLESHQRSTNLLRVPAMALQPEVRHPQKIGPYQVMSLVGVGGMGEVYRAHDSRLDRTVALKILPADVADDRERMKRFAIEAKAAGAISHPSVATIYDVGEADGITFIAMEYVEGQTLEEKTKSGPMRAADIQSIAEQIAQALNAAHSKGITHRDIKPANIMITAGGQVKILDFGLAKINRPASPGKISTVTGTVPGILIGTVEYMSPEQALSPEVDYRSDIFSLGVVLYQMATGRSPFAGMGIGETIDRILHEEPEAISRFNSAIPRQLERVIHRCLQKDRQRRYQTALEMLADLRAVRVASAVSSVDRIFSVLPPRWVVGFGALGLLFWVAAVGWLFWPGTEQTKETESTELSAKPNPIESGPIAATIDNTPKTSNPNSGTEPRNVQRQSSPSPTGEEDVRGNASESSSAANDRTSDSDSSIPTIVDTLYAPGGIDTDADGNLYIAEIDGGRVFKVTPSGAVHTIAGTGTPGFNGDSGEATKSQLMYPFGIAVDRSANIFIADAGNRRIRKVSPDGLMTTVAGNGSHGYRGDGGPATSAQLTFPRALAFDRDGTLYINDPPRLRKVLPNGIIETVTADLPQSIGVGGPASGGLAINEAGDLYIGDNNSRVLKVTPDGTISTVAGTGSGGFSGDGGPATIAQLRYPLDVSVDPAGNLYISDAGNGRVRKVTPDGLISTVAGGGDPGPGIASGVATATRISLGYVATDPSGSLYILQPSSRQSVLKVTPDGRIGAILRWSGDVIPVRVGRRGVNPARISTAANMEPGGEVSYGQGTPQIIIDVVSRIDATATINWSPFCEYVFDIARAESPAKPELSQRGRGPTLRVQGRLQPGIYSLRMRFPPDAPACGPGVRLRAIHRYVVTTAPE